MFELVFVFGAAALSVAVMNGLTGRKISGLSDCIQKLLGFAFIDLSIVILILLPFHRLNIVHSVNGSALEIGGTAVICMLLIALLVGVIAAFVQTTLSIHLSAEWREEKNEEKDERKQDTDIRK